MRTQVMRAPLSGRSRNFGFCRFSNEQERDRALVEMNGHEISGRPVRVSLATAKKTQTGLPALGPPPTGLLPCHMRPSVTTPPGQGLSADHWVLASVLQMTLATPRCLSEGCQSR